jgi:hypothetical protein
VSAEGVRRLQAALLARAYGDPALLSRALEDVDGNIRAIAGALSDAAGRWAGLRDAVTAGEVPPGMDVTGALLDAVRLVTRARDAGAKVADVINQAEMFEGPSPMARALARLFFRDDQFSRPASRKAIADALLAYADEARKNTTDERLFGEPLPESDVLATVLSRAGRADLSAAAHAAVTPEAVAKLMKAPETDEAALLELERLLQEKPDLAVPMSTIDDFGNESAGMRPVRELLAEFDHEIAEAERIATCAAGLSR